MNIPYFSIIIPVFNAETYIKNAIENILSQTEEDWELIIVNDASKDMTKSICDYYANLDSRIQVINLPENGGVANARNIGLSKAKGTYLGWVDVDDYIEIDLLSNAKKILSSYHPQLLKFSAVEEYYSDSNNIVWSKKLQLKDKYIDVVDNLRMSVIAMEEIPLFGYVWNGFYSRKYVIENNIRFNTAYTVNEDFAFNIEVAKNLKTMYSSSFIGYHYAKRINNSLSTSYQRDYYSLHLMKVQLLIDVFKSWNLYIDDIKGKIFWMYCRYTFSYYEREYINNNDKFIHVWEIVHSNPLFSEFKNIDLTTYKIKQKMLVSILRLDKPLLLRSVIWFISKIKTNFPIIFAKVKR